MASFFNTHRFICSDCNKVYKSPRWAMKHLSTHHDGYGQITTFKGREVVLRGGIPGELLTTSRRA